MKSVLKIVAAVLIAAGFVVAVASLLTPGQVILGIDFKLAATLVIGGLILLALARALALLERMSNDLRQLRKVGGETPPWLQQAAGQSGIQAAAALGLAEGAAAPAEVARQGPGSEPAQEVGQDIGGDIGHEPAATAEAEWPEASEEQWPETAEPEPETPEPAREEEAELPFPGAPAPAEQPEFDRDSGFEPEPEAEPEDQVADASGIENWPEPAQEVGEDIGDWPTATAEDDTEVSDEPEPAEAAPVNDPEEPSEPQPAAPEDAAVGDDAEMPRRLKPSQYTPWSPGKPEADEDFAEPEHSFEPDASESQAPEDQPPEEQPSGDQTSLYVVEERMFRDKQARVLSDGTVEAETAEGWMRFEDFDHLEEYLDAMAELGR